MHALLETILTYSSLWILIISYLWTLTIRRLTILLASPTLAALLENQAYPFAVHAVLRLCLRENTLISVQPWDPTIVLVMSIVLERISSHYVGFVARQEEKCSSYKAEERRARDQANGSTPEPSKAGSTGSSQTPDTQQLVRLDNEYIDRRSPVPLEPRKKQKHYITKSSDTRKVLRRIRRAEVKKDLRWIPSPTGPEDKHDSLMKQLAALQKQVAMVQEQVFQSTYEK